MISKTSFLSIAALLLSPVLASPQGGPPGGFGEGSNPSNGGSSSGPGSNPGSGFAPSASANTIIVAHAVLAALAWVLFMPVGAILLRLNLQSPIILKLHVACQILGYLIYVVAVGMGLWIIRQAPSRADLFSDPHPKIGLAILLVALFQPLWGLIHHRIFKKQASAWKDGQSTQKPGRTAWGRVHLWIGRILITVAIINGGLGLRLAARNPFDGEKKSNTGAIAYGILAGLMWLVYVVITALFEYRKAKAQPGTGTREERFALKRGGPPAYTESTESL